VLESLAFFFKSAAVTSLLVLLIGLIEPWWVLWFEAVQHRLKVIKIYGLLAVVCWALGWLIDLLAN
jgi:hypothetical protein